MKTTEEKAKAYDEALERAKTLYENANGMILKKWVEQVFPELAESEDEKIRKRLITDFGTIGKKEWGGLEVKDILDWLERQGEHANFRNKIQVGDKVTRNEDGYLVNLSQLKRVAKPSEKRGEQKPEENKGNIGGISANWSEEDERVFDSVIGDILSADTFIGGKETASYKIDWLKSLRPQNTWKPSDEQMNNK